jgi:hypothetical protein
MRKLAFRACETVPILRKLPAGGGSLCLESEFTRAVREGAARPELAVPSLPVATELRFVLLLGFLGRPPQEGELRRVCTEGEGHYKV